MHPSCNFVTFDRLFSAYRTFVVNVEQVQVSSNINKALQNPHWRTTAFDEIRSLEKNNTWQVTELLPGNILLIEMALYT